MMGQLAALVAARLPGVSVTSIGIHGDVEVLGVEANALLRLARFISTDADAAYDLVDITADDRLGRADEAPRFVVMVSVCSRTHQSRARLEILVDDDGPTWPSLSPVWPAAIIYEREIIDLFGLTTTGHPNPRRLLLPETCVGHPLRADYPSTKYQPQVPPPEVVPVEIHDPLAEGP